MNSSKMYDVWGVLGIAFVSSIWIGVDLWMLFIPEGQIMAASLSAASGVPPLLFAWGVAVFGGLMSWRAEVWARRRNELGWE